MAGLSGSFVRLGSTIPGLMNQFFIRCTFLVCMTFGILFASAENGSVQKVYTDGGYEVRVEHSPDGIGKFYMGREIAHVMGHNAADWLERPERDSEENTQLLVEQLKLRPGMVVADI